MTRPPFHLLEPCYDVQTSFYREIGRNFAPESSGMRGPSGRARSSGDPFLNAKIPTLPVLPMNDSDLDQ